MCGRCCKNLRGRYGSISPELPRSGFIFMLVPPSLKTINLLEWEVENLTELANQLSINLMIKPDILFWDEISKKALTIGWNLEYENCPFLSTENKCRIYENRPLTCQAFPIYSTGLLEYLEGQPYFLNLGDCPNIVLPPYPEGRKLVLRPDDCLTTLYRVYGETFIGAHRWDFATFWIRNLIGNLMQQEIIRPMPIRKKATVKAILRSKPIGLFKHLIMEGVISQRQVQNQILEIKTIDANKIGIFLKTLS